MNSSGKIKVPSLDDVVQRTGADGAADIWQDWHLWARPAQLPPKGDWTTWLLMGGRGAGKTRAGAEWVRQLARNGVSPIALVGETIAQARAIMVEGESGILNICPAAERPGFDRSRNILSWPDGVTAELMSGSEPERFRGPQFAAAWCDDLPHRRTDADDRSCARG